MNRPFVRLLGFYFFYLWTQSFLRAIVLPHIYSQGITFLDMIVGFLFAFGAQLLLFFFLNKNFSSRISWILAMVTTVVSIVLIIDVRSSLQYWVSAAFNGFTLYLFFIFYNIAHFEASPKEKTGTASGIMFGLPTLIGVIAPLFAGFLANINVWFAWILSFITVGFALVMIRFQKSFSISFKLLDSVKEIETTRFFIFIEGVWEALTIAFIPIYTLFFIKTTLGYGIFLAYLSVLSALATFFIGKISDKFQKRIIFLYPITLVMATVTFLFPFALHSLLIWVVLCGAISFLIPIFWNVSTAMVVDSTHNLRLAIPGREFILASGRIIGITFVLLSFLFENKAFLIFIFLGVVMLFYPLMLFWRTKISKSNSYL